MGTDPVNSHHGTWISQSNSINSTYRYPSHDLKCHCCLDNCPQSKTINLGLDLDPGAYWWGSSPPSPHYRIFRSPAPTAFLHPPTHFMYICVSCAHILSNLKARLTLRQSSSCASYRYVICHTFPNK